MSDTTTVWIPALGRGDWIFQPTAINRQPVSVPTPAAFGVGNGAATKFPLVPAPAKVDSIVASVYRNDWQGSQLLYATPRTNYVLNSETSGIWFNNTPNTPIPNAFPGGLNGTTIITGSVGGDAPNVRAAFTFGNVSANTPIVMGCLMDLTGFTDTSISFTLYTTSTGGAQLVAASYSFATGTVAVAPNGAAITANQVSFVRVSGNVWQLQMSITLNVPMTSARLYPKTSNGAASTPVMGAPLFELGRQSVGVYIPTGAAPVTVTDYTIDSAGNVVCAQAPAAGALLSWTGSYVLNTVTPGGDLQTGDDLITAVLISLFTDRIANEDDEIPDGTDDPRGWWADAGERYPIGSRLWLLSREKQTSDTAMRARDYIVESLQWLIDDGVVARFDVDVAWVAPSTLGAQVVANRIDGTTVAMNFASVWQGIN